LKHLHRLIVTSAAYRQSSEQREDAAKLDADNRLLWRMNRLRLDADSYRDYVLAARTSSISRSAAPACGSSSPARRAAHAHARLHRL
jgi:hypothetical protein